MKFKKSVVGSVISLALSASILPASAVAQQITVPASKLQQASKATPAKKSGVFIIQLKDASGVAYAEEIGELSPSNQVVSFEGNKYNAKSSRIKQHTERLKAQQKAIASSAGNIDIIYNYVHTFNGFAAKLSKEQAQALKSNPNVVGVWEDELQKITTANTPEFLGLTGPNGQHTLGIKGEDVVIGILDTGITPENPSFADDGSYSDPADIGWNGACEKGEDETFFCNDKLIGARYYKDTFETVYDIQTELGEFISPRDADGHGSHTSGTAAGNEGVVAMKHGTELGVMSGIAPRARLAMYKVCWNSDYVTPDGADEAGCFPSDSMAAIDQAIVDGVDVINFSIGGSLTDLTYPSTAAMLRAANAGVFVSVSAGNSGPAPETTGTPAPWVTTVAASTYEGVSYTNALEVTNDGTSELVRFVEGAITKPLSETGPVSGDLVAAEPLRACYGESVEALPLDNAAEIDGNIALIQRGDCAFTEKVSRAIASGAKAVVVYTVEGNPITALGGDYVGVIPGGMIGAQEGDELYASLANGENVSVELSSAIFIPQQEEGNIMADFSSRGPNLATRDLIKPDITAPGVRILAATTDTPMFKEQGQQVAYLSGTSMSSPHIAGLAALLMQQHPDWSPAQVRSALMTTAYQDVLKEDGETPAGVFDFGAGHANPVPAMEPGLTYDANLLDYMAFMCGMDEDSFVLDQSGYTCSQYQEAGFSIDPSQLNYPSIAVGQLSSTKTVYRTLTDVSGTGGNYTIDIDGLAGLDVSVATFDAAGVETESPNLVVEPSGKAAFGVTFTKNAGAVLGEWEFGSITLAGEDGTEVRSPIAVMPVADINIDVPESVSIDLKRGRGSFPVQTLYNGRMSIDYKGLTPASGTVSSVEDDPASSFEFLGAGTSYTAWLVPEGSTSARFSLRDSLVSQDGADLDLYIYRCIGYSCDQVGSSANASSDEDVILRDPAPAADGAAGDFYIAMVHGYQVPGGVTDFTQLVWVTSQKESTTRITTSPRAVDGRYNMVNILTRGLAEVTHMGTVSFYDDDGNLQGTTILEVTP